MKVSDISFISSFCTLLKGSLSVIHNTINAQLSISGVQGCDHMLLIICLCFETRARSVRKLRQPDALLTAW